MSVKIEILDYEYGTGGNLVNMDDGTPQTGWSFANSTTADWDGDGSNNSLYYNGISTPLVVGHEYTVTLKVTNYTTSAIGEDMGVSSGNISGSANGVGTSVRLSSNGTVTYTFTCTASGSIRIYGRGYNNGTQEVTIVDNDSIDWNKSILGELDITDHSDFPLALTFQISDLKDLTSTSGDYSKTFKIPATKNNNKIFKHLFIPNIDSPNKATESKRCRILINNLYSLVGLIRVSGIGGSGEEPSYYNCIFFGNNLSWAADLEGKYMDTIDWGTTGEALTYNKNSIVATWQHEDSSNASNSPIVYPITSYGQENAGGIGRTIQLLDTATDANGWLPTKVGYWGFADPSSSSSTEGNSYGTPEPSPDWRPSVFVKTTLEKIFSPLGYIINSEFMDTDMFKKLVWLLPNFTYNNPDDRSAAYNVESNFHNGVSLTTTTEPGSVSVNDDGIYKASWGGYVRYEYEDYFLTELGRGANQAPGGVPTTPTYPDGTPNAFPLDSSRLNVTLDNGSYVDTTNNEITIGEYGYYTISLNGIQGRLAEGHKGGGDNKYITSIQIALNLEIQTVGQSSWNIVNNASDTQSPHQTNTAFQWTDSSKSLVTEFGDLSSISETRYLNKGDKIRLTTGFKILDTSDNNQNFVITTFYRAAGNSANFNISISPDYVEYGQTYNLKDVMNPEYKQLDFIKGVTHAFNLNMTTDEITKTINIEPFNTFYKPYGSAIDWTYKLDRDKEIQDKWLKTDLKRNIVFKYKTDDKDGKIQYRGPIYFGDVDDEFPYRETLPPTFEKGLVTYENPFFAGSYNAKNQNTVGGDDYIDTAFSACLWTENVSANDAGRPAKGFEFLPRLLYWNKYSPAIGSGHKIAAVQTWITTDWITADAEANPTYHLSLIYPQATMINGDRQGNDSTNLLTYSPNLAYGSTWTGVYDDATNTYASLFASKGLYDTYYKNMIEMFKQNPRIRTLYIDLKTVDILNLDFTKLIYIDGVYWRLSKVIDFQPNKNEPVKVELIEWFQLGQFAATAPTVGDTGGFGGGGAGDPIPTNNDLGL